jgi:hypothetical protein
MPIRHELKHASSSFWAWFAGFMDGDGAIVFERHGNAPPQAKISIVQKEPSPLAHIVETLGVGSMCVDKRGYTHLTMGTYASRECIKRLLPHLISDGKREKAARALDWTPQYDIKHFGTSETNPKYGEALRLYASGIGSDAVGNRLGVAGITVRRWAKKAGIFRG